jgi:hypothetical protein
MSLNHISNLPIFSSSNAGNELSEEDLQIAMQIVEQYHFELEVAAQLINPNIRRRVLGIMEEHKVDVLTALQLISNTDEEIPDILSAFIRAEAINTVSDEESNASDGHAETGGNAVVAASEGSSARAHSQWECSSCTLLNESNEAQCVLCEAPKVN